MSLAGRISRGAVMLSIASVLASVEGCPLTCAPYSAQVQRLTDQPFEEVRCNTRLCDVTYKIGEEIAADRYKSSDSKLSAAELRALSRNWDDARDSNLQIRPWNEVNADRPYTVRVRDDALPGESYAERYAFQIDSVSGLEFSQGTVTILHINPSDKVLE